MAEIILGSDTNPGGRKYNEDRFGFETFVNKAGVNLAVGIVCDGVGGEERGERAAQLAIDTFMATIRESDITETPRLLNNAVKTANLAAYTEAQRMDAGERMACTLVAVVIENGQTMYLANVGDSRIYLSREGQLRQLTRDHTFENVMIWMGRLSPEAAAANPDASKVMRVLGTRDNIQVDLGIYLTTTNYGDANRIGREGFKLLPGDSIIICSDGLVKDTATTGKPLVMDAEIARILGSEEGPKAARAIMSIALGRIPVGEQVDNITLVTMQTEDPNRAANFARMDKLRRDGQRRDTSRKMALIAAAVGIPLCGLLVVAVAALAGVISFTSNNAKATEAQLAMATSNSLAQTQTVAAYTPTPTVPPPTSTPLPTIVPTLSAGEIAKLFRGDELLRPIFDDRKPIVAPPGQSWYIAVKHRDDLPETGNIYMEGSSQTQFSAVTDSRIQLNLLPGSDLFFQTGPYSNGAEVELAGLSVVASVKGCMAAYYVNDSSFVASCFNGECGLSINFGADYTLFDEGQQVTFDLNTLEVSETKTIPIADSEKYWNLLSQTSAGRQDAGRCSVPNFEATQAAIETAAAAVARTRTAVAAAATQSCQTFRNQFPGTPCP
jgi:PPM family protein phosphatase